MEQLEHSCYFFDELQYNYNVTVLRVDFVTVPSLVISRLKDGNDAGISGLLVPWSSSIF